MIRDEIKRAMNIVLPANTLNAQVQSEDIANNFPGQGTIPTRPLVLPYGLAARAPDGTNSMTARIGTDPGARYVIGHRDAKRPDPGAGCSMLYNEYGQVVWLQNGKVLLGSMQATHAYVFGDVLQQCLSTVLSAIAAHTHTDSLGGLTTPPLNAATFTGQASSPVDDGSMLSKTTVGS